MSAATAPHVLITADAVGGVWQYALTLARELILSDHRVTLALLGPRPSDDQRAQAASVAGLELVETDLPLDWLSDGPHAVTEAARGIADLARRLGPDVVHCNSPALIAGTRFPAPVVAVAHGCLATWWEAARAEPLPHAMQWHADMMTRGLRAADVAVAPSKSFAETLKRTYGLSRAPLAVHNGRPPLDRRPADRQHDAGLSVGRLWDEVKRADVLDRAAGLGSCPILAAGALRGPHGEEFAPRHLQVLGYQSEAALARLYALRPVFISTASFEPFGLAVLEAASAGCALVLSDIPTFRELWDGAAIFVPVGDAAGSAETLAMLIEDPGRREALGAAAKERSGRYTPAATAAAMIAIYEAALARCEAAA